MRSQAVGMRLADGIEHFTESPLLKGMRCGRIRAEKEKSAF